MASSGSVNKPAKGHWYPPPATSDADLTKKIKKKNKKDSKKVPPSSAVQPCPYAKKNTTKEDTRKKSCTFSALKVSKPKRGFDLIVNPSTPNEKRTLGIVAGFKKVPAKVFFDLEGPAGPCVETHNKKRSFNTGCGTFKILPGSTENKLEIEVTSSTKIQLFPWGLKTDKYTISANRCGHANESATIEVYPDTQTDIFIGWDFGSKTNSTETTTTVQKNSGTNQYKKAEAKKGLAHNKTTTTTDQATEVSEGLRIGGTIRYDGEDFIIEAVFKKTIETIKKINEVVKKAQVALEKIKGNKKSSSSTSVFSSPVSMGIKLPVLELHVGGAWTEDAGKPTVTYEGKIKFKGKPLFGLSFAWNITDTVINALPGGPVVAKIKKKLVDGFLELVVKAGLEIHGEIELAIKHHEIENVVGKLQGKIPISAELTVIKFSKDVYFAHATVEYKVGVESGFRVGFSYEAHAKVFKCTGGMLDFIVWWSGGMEFGGAEKKNKPSKYAEPEVSKGTEGKHVLYSVNFEDETFGTDVHEHVFFEYDFKKP